MRVRHLHGWLLALSDPRGQRELPAGDLPAEHWPRVCEIADFHGTLPAVMANARRALPLDAPALDVERMLADARQRLIGRTALALAIRGQIREIATALKRASVSAAVLKGADFADHLYPDPSLRPFTDLDLLVPLAQVEAVEAVMSQLGYASRRVSMKYNGGYGERSWARPGRREGVVEIHWNLVNSPTLRRGVTVCWEDLAFESPADGKAGVQQPMPASRLLIAAVHAAASHGFDRLQPLCDVCLAARQCTGEPEIRWLADAVGRTGARLPLAASLALAARLFDEPACRALQSVLGLPRGGAWTVLLSPSVVLRGHSRLDSFRRQLFRETLKRR